MLSLTNPSDDRGAQAALMKVLFQGELTCHRAILFLKTTYAKLRLYTNMYTIPFTLRTIKWEPTSIPALLT